MESGGKAVLFSPQSHRETERIRIEERDWFESLSNKSILVLRDEMWSYDADEFAGRNYFCLLPELGKMPLVASDQVIGASSIGAFQELVVVGILRDLKRSRRMHELRMILYELEKLPAKAPADAKFPA